ncbi:MAG: GDSL-type esterase/lipase family protein [Lacisediminihabitans sp.]
MTEETIVFLGDSITQNGDWASWFPEANTVNLGVSGDTTDDVLLRLDAAVEAAPDSILLLIGTNDLGTRQSVEHLVRNIQLMLVQLRRELPGTRMLVQSILPRAREFADRVQDANIHLRQFAATVHAQYLDLWPAFAEHDGEINPAYSDDRLHLTAAGYEAWLGELRPALHRLKDEPPMTSPIRAIHIDEYARPERT